MLEMTKQQATKLGRAADTIVGAMAREKLSLPALAGKAIDVLESRNTPDAKLSALGLRQKCRSFADIARNAAALITSPLAFNRARTAPAKPGAKPSARPPQRTAPARAAAKPLERDNGSRLMAARNFWRETMTEAHRLSRIASRNLTAAELRFIKAARQLPRRAPNENNTLREWRHFATLIEQAAPSIKAARRI